MKKITLIFLALLSLQINAQDTLKIDSLSPYPLCWSKHKVDTITLNDITIKELLNEENKMYIIQHDELNPPYDGPTFDISDLPINRVYPPNLKNEIIWDLNWLGTSDSCISRDSIEWRNWLNGRTGVKYKGELFTGTRCGYFNEDTKRIEPTMNYKEGAIQGYYCSFYENGNKAVETFFINGKVIGDYIMYNEDGTIYMKSNKNMNE
jgi:hypothetical protein